MKSKSKRPFGPDTRNYMDCNGVGMPNIQNRVEDTENTNECTYDSEYIEHDHSPYKKDKKL